MTAEAAEIPGVAQNTLFRGAARASHALQSGYRLFKRNDLKKFLRQVESSSTSAPKRNK